MIAITRTGEFCMPVLKDLERKAPATPNGRVRNYLASRQLGAACTIHENLINPGGIVPMHHHTIEEVIVVLEGTGEFTSDDGVETYRGGDVIIVPARMKHRIRNIGPIPIRQIAFFAGDSGTQWDEAEVAEGHSLAIAK
jgi:quercetin dioxygenase-like cupin family protein